MLNTKILDVPYLTQPTPITCQSTCLKMYAKYLEQKLQMSSLGAGFLVPHNPAAWPADQSDGRPWRAH